MSPEDVRTRVQRINAMRDDDEAAHIAEDVLNCAVLRAIADGAPDAPALAAEALATLLIPFERRYA